MANTITAHDAATEIVALINARPSSPHQEEIEAIITKAVGTAPLIAPDGGERRRTLQAAIAGMEGSVSDDDQEDQIKVLEAALTSVTKQVWTQPARTVADLHDHALIARHWLQAHSHHGPWRHPSEVDDWADRAYAYLIDAVLGFGGQVVPDDAPLPIGGDLLIAALGEESARDLRRWNATLCRFLEAWGPSKDAECERLSDQIAADTLRFWAQPVRGLADVIVRLAIAVHWNSPGDASDPAYPDDIIADGPECSMDDYATAMVMRGLLDLAGLQFDPEGRLLSVMQPEPWCKDECGPA